MGGRVMMVVVGECGMWRGREKQGSIFIIFMCIYCVHVSYVRRPDAFAVVAYHAWHKPSLHFRRMLIDV